MRGCRFCDALFRAGGSTLYPRRGQSGANGQTGQGQAAAAKPAATQLLDINTATEDELRALKGVGDVRAANIIKNRPYKGKDELVQKNIIPPAVYAANQG